MQTGVLLNAFTCFLIAVATFANAIRIFRQYKNSRSDLAFAAFWFLTSFSWIFVGLSMVVSKYNLLSSGIVIDQYFTQTTVFFQMAIGSYYAAYRVFKSDKLSTLVFVFFLIAACLGLSFVYQQNGVVITKSSYFTIEYGTVLIPWQIFQGMFAIVILAMLFDFLRNVYLWFKKSPLYQQRYLLASLSVCAYGIICYFEEQGYVGASENVATWIRLALRMVLILCAQVAFLAYGDKDNETYYINNEK